MVVRRNTVSYFSSETDLEPVGVFTLLDCDVQQKKSRSDGRRYCITVVNQKKDTVLCILAAETADSYDRWVEVLLCACVPYAWPGGSSAGKRTQPLSITHLATLPYSESPLVPLPQLKSMQACLRKAVVLRKIRLCSVIFDGPDSTSNPDEREMKRSTLQELVEFHESDPKVFCNARISEDTIAMIRMNLFRSLPKPVVKASDPEEDEQPFMDPQWTHLALVYELLLRVISNDHINVQAKKKLIDAHFVRQLLLLFDSEDFRERDYLKNIAHRIYSKLTQRRAQIRRVICNIFFEFVFETDRHNGIGEMLEILASIVNGFCVPIKDEHKVMLVRALIPLHKSTNITMYHPQLSYCMVLYVSKDHTLTREVVSGLLKYWPYGSSTKQTMFLNQLEDLFEYVQLDDLEVFRDQLLLRLGKAIGGLHFQVAERALCLWNCERFCQLLQEDSSQRQHVLPTLFPILYRNSISHWHESVKTLSAHVLHTYMEVDPDLYSRCAEAWDAVAKAATATAPTLGNGCESVHGR